jgi:GH25 family lysozyme M1 (1,4-beta-N-acetylmuramidase)
MKRQTHKHIINVQALGHDCRRLSALFDEQNRVVRLLMQQYIPMKGNQFDCSVLVNAGRNAITTIDPQAYFYIYQSLLVDKKAPRTLSVLMDVYYEVRLSWHDLQQWQDYFTTTYAAAQKTYYSNIADLMKLQEDLKEYVRGKKLNKQAADWVQGYFTLFDQWLRTGANKEMKELQQEIVLKIPELNHQQPGSPFGSKTNEKAFECSKAFDTVTQLDEALFQKVQRYRTACKRAAKVTGMLATGMLPAMTQPVLQNGTATKTPVRHKWLAGVGVVLLAVICFWGGRFTHDRQPVNMAATTATSHQEKAIADTVSRKASVAVEKAQLFPLDTMTTICGLDISKYQGNLLKELNQLDTMHFVICKATQGTTLVDVDFNYNWQRLQQLKLVRGAYHFFMAKDDPVQQARHFLKTVGTLSGKDIPLIIDIEEGSITHAVNKKQLQNDLLICLQYLHTHSGKKPVIYTDLSFANTWLQQSAFAAYPLWLAEYSRHPAPVLPQTWKDKGIVFWQKNDTLTINSRKTDFDIFVGNGAAFLEFLGG